MLYAIGSVLLEVAPLNVEEVSRSSGADFAGKDLMGRKPAFEFTGVQAQSLRFRGKIFPEVLGGLDEFEALRQLMISGVAQHVVRGDGAVMGWYRIETLSEVGRYLNAQGVPKMIEIDIALGEGDPVPGGEYQGAQLALIDGDELLSALNLV